MSLKWQFKGGAIRKCPRDALLFSDNESLLLLPTKVNVSDALQHFACLCALDVINFWTAPSVVQDYLKTRDRSLENKAKMAITRSYKGEEPETNFTFLKAVGHAIQSIFKRDEGTTTNEYNTGLVDYSNTDLADLHIYEARWPEIEISTKEYALKAAYYAIHNDVWHAAKYSSITLAQSNISSQKNADLKMRQLAQNKEDERQRQRLFILLAPFIVPLPETLQARLDEDRRLKFEAPSLRLLYLGHWWEKELPGLEYIEI